MTGVQTCALPISVEHARGKGLPSVLHCCGNLNKIFRMIIDTGVNAIQAIQPSANNNIYQYKKEYGKDICLIGNIDINELLPYGTPMQIDATIREMVEGLFFDHKGWVLGTCNLINYDVPVVNAVTMHLAAEKYGRNQ